MIRRVALFSIVALESCSGQNSQHDSESHFLDIASPGDLEEKNVLLWFDTDSFVKGACTPNKPTTRANCSQSMQKVLESRAVQFASSNLKQANDSAISAVTAEISKLKDSDATVISIKAEINSLTVQKNSLDAALKKNNEELAKNERGKIEVDGMIKFLDEQIAEVSKVLTSNPNDSIAKAQLDALIVDKQEASSELENVIRDIVFLKSAIGRDSAEGTAVANRIAECQKRFKSYYDSLQVRSTELTRLQGISSVAKRAMESLDPVVGLVKQSSVSYRESILSVEQKMALKALNESFTSAQILTDGRYNVVAGYLDFCPQKIQTAVQGGVLKSLTLSYLSPCSGSGSFTCSGSVCTSGSKKVTILGPKKYNYSNGSTGTFEWNSPSLMDVGAENGPEESVRN